MPAVSIVVPCFNGGRFFEPLLAGLKAQTFRDFEIIIVNDGSTERLTVDKLAVLEPAIRVIHQENRGLSAARNAGFRAAKADLVLPLDCDDTLEPGHLAETVAVMERAPPKVGFIYTDERLVGGRTGIAEHRFNRYDQLFVNRLSYCLLLRKSAWAAVGGYDEAMREGYEDWEFNIRLVKFGFDGLGVAKPLVVYRVSTDGMLMNRSSVMHGTLWRRIRDRHPELYRLAALLRRWRADGSRIGLGFTLALLAAAKILPDAWFSAGVHWVRRRKFSEKRRGAAAHVLAPAE
jgi:glycosyltransferase involved in cell wall biosynthesis